MNFFFIFSTFFFYPRVVFIWENSGCSQRKWENKCNREKARSILRLIVILFLILQLLLILNKFKTENVFLGVFWAAKKGKTPPSGRRFDTGPPKFSLFWRFDFKYLFLNSNNSKIDYFTHHSKGNSFLVRMVLNC